jgi:pimeloyl-ACP methyl ester carboxylesterase
MPEIELSHGTIHYRDQGSGPVIVLIHGLLVNATVWDPLIAELSTTARCVAPDLPLGSHRIPMPRDADLSPLGIANLIAELLETLELTGVTLVGNDTGGALCQLVCAHHPARVGGLVLTNCDAFEHFPPPAFRLMVRALARVPGAVATLDLLARDPYMRRMALSMAPLTVERIPDATVKGWIAPLHDRAVRRDLVRVARGIDARVMLDAEPGLRSFDRPALIVWGMRDKFFPVADAERLTQTLPLASLERIDNARTFVQLDAPERLAELVGGFMARAAGVPAVPSELA